MYFCGTCRFMALRIHRGRPPSITRKWNAWRREWRAARREYDRLARDYAEKQLAWEANRDLPVDPAVRFESGSVLTRIRGNSSRAS